MIVDGSISLLKERESSTRDAIVNILANKWPLTVKDICGELARGKTVSVSYQAVHKTILQLEAEGIVERSGRNYRLNKRWIMYVKEFGVRLEEAYSSAKNGFDLPADFKGTLRFKFTDLSHLCTSLAELFRRQVLSCGEDPTAFGFFDHAIWPLEFAFPDFVLLRDMAQSVGKAIAVVRKDSPFDRMIANYYKLAGVTIYTGIDHGMDNYYFVQGPTIIEIRRSPETIAIMDQIYEKIDSLPGLFAFYIQNKDKLRMEFDVSVYKNRDLANLLREKAKALAEGR